MTRETKIGLLVGLAFIIVIGILLADYSAGFRPPAAPLVGAGQNVRGSAVSPGSRRTDSGKVAMGPVEPDRTVPISGNSGGGRPFTTVNPDAGNSVREINAIGDRRPDDRRAEDRRPDDRRTEDRRTEDRRSDVAPDPREGRREEVRHEEPTGVREIKAEQGDTVSKWATKYFGANTKANRELIIKANPSLAAHPNKIVVNDTYVIPPAPGTEPKLVVDRRPDPPAPPAAEKVVAYAIKPGDNLWKIAVDQCGNAAMVAKFRELNKDVLKNGDTLRLDMTLKLPAKG